MNVYAPNSYHISFLNKMWRKIERIKYGTLIWCGHFNPITDASMDFTSKSIRPLFNSIHGYFNRISMTSGDATTRPKRIIHSTLIDTKHIPE